MTAPRQPDRGHELSFDRSVPGRRAVDVPDWEGEPAPLPSGHLLRERLPLPELSQGALVRYYTALSGRNFGVDSDTYPLGSCTMKYNPKLNDRLASLAGLAQAHPLAEPERVQGTLRLLHELQTALGALTGLPAVSLAAAAGAQGELAGMSMIKKALALRGELDQRRRVLVPDSAHGTNPASAAMAGFTVTQIATAETGSIDMPALVRELGPDVACLMVTLPNTLGLWEEGIEEVVRHTHAVGGVVYGDGANFNALLGRLRFGDLGFDIVHLNLHKTFSTPHGGGGPGAGPVCTTPDLAPLLPSPIVERDAAGTFRLERPVDSIGPLQAFHGSIGVLLRAYAYVRSLGAPGLRAISENAVLNANYLRARLREAYDIPYDRPVLHEVVVSAARLKREHNIRAYDIAKRLIDYGFHPPTVYFPLIVDEALMIEPTETESREDLDRFIEAMLAIAEEARTDPELLREAPHSAPIGRLDEVEAARRPVLSWRALES